jgi:hypothetical protein
MLALCDEVMGCGSYARWHTSTSTSSSNRYSHVADSAAEERDRHRDETVQNLKQSHQHILEILHVKVLYMLNLSNSI